MLQTQPKIVFFDIDETLYLKAEKRIPNSIIEQVIPRLKAKGVIPAIATGRCIGAFPEALKPLLNEDGFELLVSVNGQYNCYQNQVISQYSLPFERIEQAIDKLNTLGIAYALVSHDEIAVSCATETVHNAIFPIKTDYIVEPNLHHQQAIYQLLAFFSESQEQQVIESGILGEDLRIVRWHTDGVDLLSKHNSKAKGIQDVLRYFGFSLGQAMAFGDGLNDLEMLSQVGIGIAMGNAEPALKALADYVTLPIDQDGILHALEHYGVI